MLTCFDGTSSKQDYKRIYFLFSGVVSRIVLPYVLVMKVLFASFSVKEKCYKKDKRFQFHSVKEDAFSPIDADIVDAEECWKECYHDEECEFFTFNKNKKSNRCQRFFPFAKDHQDIWDTRADNPGLDVFQVSGRLDCFLPKKKVMRFGGAINQTIKDKCFRYDKALYIDEVLMFRNEAKNKDECMKLCSEHYLGCWFFTFKDLGELGTTCQLDGVYNSWEQGSVSGRKACLEQ